MAQDREISGNPLVSLDARSLLGMGHGAGKSAAGLVDSGGSTGGVIEPRVEVSRLFSKISLPPETAPAIEQA